MEKKALILFIVLFLVINFNVLGQNVGIGTSTPDGSAALEINSNDKGLLIPRMDSVARKAILSPATGLLVFDIDNNSFWYKTPSVWVELKPAVFENNSGTVRNAGESTDDFVFGRDQLPPNNINISDRLFFFDESKGAFRAGRIQGSKNWSTDSLGNYSCAFGTNNVAKGENTFATGLGSIASGNNSNALGIGTKAIGTSSLTANYLSKAIGDYSNAMNVSTKAIGNGSFSIGYFSEGIGVGSFAMGFHTKANGSYSVSIGDYTTADSYSSVALGRFNVGGGVLNSWLSSDPLFEIGIGSSIVDKKNALTVKKDGTVSFKDYTFPNNLGLTDQILKNDGIGNIEWKNDIGAFENNSGTVRNAGQSTDDFVFGRDQLPQNNINISDRLFFFDESKGAFRAGGLVLSNK